MSPARWHHSTAVFFNISTRSQRRHALSAHHIKAHSGTPLVKYPGQIRQSTACLRLQAHMRMEIPLHNGHHFLDESASNCRIWVQ